MIKQHEPQHDPIASKLLGEIETRYPFLITQLVALHAGEIQTTVSELSLIVTMTYVEERRECQKDGGMVVGVSTHAVAARLGALVGLQGDTLGISCQLPHFAISVWEQVTAVTAAALAQ